MPRGDGETYNFDEGTHRQTNLYCTNVLTIHPYLAHIIYSKDKIELLWGSKYIVSELVDINGSIYDRHEEDELSPESLC